MDPRGFDAFRSNFPGVRRGLAHPDPARRLVVPAVGRETGASGPATALASAFEMAAPLQLVLLNAGLVLMALRGVGLAGDVGVLTGFTGAGPGPRQGLVLPAAGPRAGRLGPRELSGAGAP